MSYKGKELADIIVTLPLTDGTQMECGVVANFEVDDKAYFVLLPFNEEKKPDFTKNYMIYRVEEDAEGNPMILYIEDDHEYNVAAQVFTENYL